MWKTNNYIIAALIFSLAVFTILEQHMSDKTIQKYNEFEKACIYGELINVTALAPSNLNYRIEYSISEDGETPLILAVRNRQTDVVRFLLKNGADPNLTSHTNPKFDYNRWHEGIYDKSPLYVAAYHADIEIIQLLLSNGAEVNFLSTAGDTPLTMATRTRNVTVVKLLLKYGADPNLYRRSVVLSGIPLFWAVYQGDLEMVKELLNQGAKVNAKNTEDETALFWAFLGDRKLEIMKELVNHGIDINARNKEGETVLSKTQSGKSPSPEIVQFLKQQGAKE